MRKSWFAVVGVCAVFALTALVQAAPKVKPPKISSGGVTQNFNSVTPWGTVKLLTLGGFTAHATGEGISMAGPNWPLAWALPTVYVARGQVQASFASADDPSVILGEVHGSVVCIANLGPSGTVDGDDPNDDVTADPLGDVWEVRFEITQVNGEEPPAAIYASFFVQDGGKADFADESFSGATIFDASCGNNPYFGLEPQLTGNIQVQN